MLDRYSLKILKPLLGKLAAFLRAKGISADQITIISFGVLV